MVGKMMRPLQNQRGVALLLSLVALMMMYFIAMEVSFDSTVDYNVAHQQVDRVKAYYAAKAGVELSLLRIMLYKQATAALGDSLGGQISMLDPIWNFPFMWPPTLSMGKDSKLMESDKDDMKESMTESLMQAQYTTTIAPEGGRLDINDLGSDSKAFAKVMAQQVLDIFKSQLEHDEAFRRKYSGYRFEELVNNIADYVDTDTESRNAGDESGLYQDVNSATMKLPPNRGFRTLDELHQVAGMTDDLYEVLAPRVTVFGTKGINVNYAPKNVLMALDPTMNDQAVDKVIERRGNPKIGGPFKDDKDFFGFIQGYRVNTKALEDSKFPFFYDVEFNFRIVSTGLSSNVKRDITVVTYDYPNLAQRLAKILNDQDKADGRDQPVVPPPGGGLANVGTGAGAVTPADPGAQKTKIQSAKGRPTVVYWEEN